MIAERWFASLAPLQLAQALGPVQSLRWSVAGRGGGGVERGPFPPTSMAYAHEPWLKFSVEQLESLSGPQRDRFDQRLIAHAQRFFAHALPSPDAQACSAWAAACRERAAQYGMTSEACVLGWVALYAEFGAGFPEAPEHHAYRALLMQPGVAAAQRLDNALRKQLRQAYGEQEVAA